LSRHTARETALQMLFQMDIGGNSYEIAQNTLTEANLSKELAQFTEELVLGVTDKQTELDGFINSHSHNWRVDRLSGVDRAILRLAVYELNYTKNIPANVVINEAIELAKFFSGDEAPAFVNGVLDSILAERDKATLESAEATEVKEVSEEQRDPKE